MVFKLLLMLGFHPPIMLFSTTELSSPSCLRRSILTIKTRMMKDPSSWNTSAVEWMQYTFRDATAFDQVYICREIHEEHVSRLLLSKRCAGSSPIECFVTVEEDLLEIPKIVETLFASHQMISAKNRRIVRGNKRSKGTKPATRIH
jgi:hypothetical protein